MAQRGYRVALHEKREGIFNQFPTKYLGEEKNKRINYGQLFFQDIRRTRTNQGRSINLALSHRGRKALRLIGMEEKILKNAIPMSARFLHNEVGSTTIMPYDPVSKQVR